MSPSEKEEIYQAAMAQLKTWYGGSFAPEGTCLYLTQVAMRELLLRGYQPRMIAGDLLWRVVPASEDDGEICTHWGYEWSPTEPLSQRAISEGRLPEVHIWCELGDEIVDFATEYLPDLAALFGHKWRTAAPPKYLFGTPPEDAVYRPSYAATKFVWNFIIQKQTSELCETA